MRVGGIARFLTVLSVLASVFLGGGESSTASAVSATVPTCNVLRFTASSSLSTRPGGTTVRAVLTSHYFPTCEWSYSTKYRFYTATKTPIGAALDFKSSPTVAIPVSPWPVNDTFQVVQNVLTEEGVQCNQQSATYLGIVGANGARVLVPLPSVVGVCVGGTATWSSLGPVSFPKPSPCATSALRLSVGRGNGTAGTTYYPLIFTNVGSKACAVSGVPSVQPTLGAVAAANPTPVGPPATVRDLSSSGYGDAVRLAPKAQASAAFGVGDTANFSASQCVAASFRSITVGFAVSSSWRVALAGSTCVGATSASVTSSTSISGVVPGATGLAP